MTKFSNNEIKAKLMTINNCLDSTNNSIINFIRNISDLSSDQGLTGKKYNDVKRYFNTIYVATCYAFLRANDEFIQANNTAINAFDNAFNGECDIIDTADLERKQKEINQLNADIQSLSEGNYQDEKYYNEEEKKEEVYRINTHKNDGSITNKELEIKAAQKIINLINRINECDSNIKNIYSHAYVLYEKAKTAEDAIQTKMYDSETFKIDYSLYDVNFFASLLQDENDTSLAVTSSIVNQDDIVMYMIWYSYSLTTGRNNFDTTRFESYISSKILAAINNDKEMLKDIIAEIQPADFTINAIKALKDNGLAVIFRNCDNGFIWSFTENSSIYQKYYLPARKIWGPDWIDWASGCTVLCVATTSYLTGFSVETVASIFKKDGVIITSAHGGSWGANQTKREDNGCAYFKSVYIDTTTNTTYEIKNTVDSNGKVINTEKINEKELSLDDIKVGMIIDYSKVDAAGNLKGHVVIVTDVDKETGIITMIENWDPINKTIAPMTIRTYTIDCSDGDLSGLYENGGKKIVDFVYTDVIYENGQPDKTADPNYVPEPLS